MFFKPYYLGCLAHASYLIGGDNGEAAVIDPRRDVDEYLADADAAGLTIQHVIETHLHADFVSGHVELAERTGATITLGAAAWVKFPHRAAHESDEIVMGDVRLRFLETPGHTPEGLSVLVFVGRERDPRMAFTGDTLFISDVGRPDLAGWRGHSAESMAHAMYHTLKDKLLTLADSTEIWPAHGAGSACGRALSDARVSTVGREKMFNPALRMVLDGDADGFVRALLQGQSAVPPYFPHDVIQNRSGAATIAQVQARARVMTPREVQKLTQEQTQELTNPGTLMLDTRSPDEFGGGHAPGAINIGLDGKFASWAGSLLHPDTPIIVVATPGREKEAVTRLARIGYENVVGWIAGGMDAWRELRGALQVVPQIPAASVCNVFESRPVLDVRAADEWTQGHIPGSLHIPLGEMAHRLDEIPCGPLLVLCGSGYRSSIACSLLQRAGNGDVVNVRGGWSAWQKWEQGHAAA